MALDTAPDCLLASNHEQESVAKDIEMWMASDLNGLGPHYVVTYKRVTEYKHCKTGTGTIWAFVSKDRPPAGTLQKLVQRSFLIRRTLRDEDAVDLLVPYKLAEILTQ